MKTVSMPSSDAEMLRVEPVFVSDNHDDIPVAYRVAKESVVMQLLLRDIAVFLPFYPLFHLAYHRDILGVDRQHTVFVGMLCHIVCLNGLYRGKGRVRPLYLPDEVHGGIVFYP